MARIDTIDVSSREIFVRDWVRRQLGSISHELRVCSLAEKLFGLTQRWHQLGVAELKTLRLAGLLHDVGRAKGSKGHAKTGARMIKESLWLPLGAADRRRLAFLIRHHRGQVPEQGAEKHLDCGLDDIRTMRILLGLLRSADGLDSRTGGGHQYVATVRGGTLTIFGYVSGDATSAAKALGKPKKFSLLESMLDCEVRTEWFSTDRLALVS